MNQPSINPCKQLTVLQLVPSLRSGGVERGTVEVSQGLVEAGWRSIVASTGGQMVSQIEGQGATHLTLPIDRKGPMHILRNAKMLASVIKEYQVDVVHARSRAPAWAGWLATRQTGTPFVTTFHGFYGLGGMKKHYNKVMTYGQPTIAVSDFIRQHIMKHYTAGDDSNIQIIHSGVDTSYFDPAKIEQEKVEDLKHYWEVPPNLPVILLPGRLTRWKGQHILLKALGKLPHRNFYCILLGDQTRHPNYKGELKGMIRKYRLKENVCLIPSTSQMLDAYVIADLVVVPSIDPEAFGRIPAEAQSMGKPVIATNHGGACETVKHGVTGWLVPPKDIDAMAAAIEEVLALSEEKKQQMGASGRKYMQQNFDTSIVRSKTLAIYQDCVKQKSSLKEVA